MPAPLVRGVHGLTDVLRPYALDTQQSRDVVSINIDVSRLESSPEDADFDPRWTVLYTGQRSIAPESGRRHTGATGP